MDIFYIHTLYVYYSVHVIDMSAKNFRQAEEFRNVAHRGIKLGVTAI